MGAVSKLVLVHGFGTSAQVWDRVRGVLDRPALAPDLPGFGLNTGPEQKDANWTVDGMVDALAGTVRAAGLESYLLVGHSMGAKVCTVLAARRPPGLVGLLLISPSPPTPEPMTETDRERLRAAWNQPERLREQYLGILRQPLPAACLDDLVQDGQRASRGAWNAWLDRGHLERREADARRVEVPVRVLGSFDDSVITPSIIQQGVIPFYRDARLALLHGSGHLLPLELPHEVATAIREAARG